MAYFYIDTDTGDDADDGTTWALAKLTLEGLLAVMSAGDTGYIQGAAADTTATSRTFTSPGTVINPCKIVGVVDGTTNTGSSVVVSDLASTLPQVTTTAGSFTFSGTATFVNLDFSCSSLFSPSYGTANKFTGCKISPGSLINCDQSSHTIFENCEIEPTSTVGIISAVRDARVDVIGGSYTFTSAASLVWSASEGQVKFTGVDLSGLTAAIAVSGSHSEVVIANCKMPSTITKFSATPTTTKSSVTLIASDDSSSIGATSSIQSYEYENAHGTTDIELTAVRTGGADDGASGQFAYAMTPHANAVLEGSGANLSSPWMSVWVIAGSQTFTIYIANDSASTDYNEDEVWCEFYTPDAGDTAQHDQNFDPGNERLFANSTAVTDDIGSTWGTGANNHQKMSVTVTTGFEGWAYARLHLAKRQATPDTLFLDPKIEVI